MIKVLKYLFLLLLPVAGLSQEFNKFIALDNHKNGKRVKYFENDFISIRSANGVISGTITEIKDTSFKINTEEISLREVIEVRRSRRGIPAKTGLFGVAGLLFLGLDAGYRAIEDDRPIIQKKAVIISASLISTAVLAHFLKIKRYKLKKNRKLKVINTSPV